ncbi:MAG TPA: HIT domain-containing protein [Kaistia sp.]|nr:HIT domain-containing protein [Kaistia sp.]
MTQFTIDPRILGDSLEVTDLGLCAVRLMDDARYPWLLLLPRRPGLEQFTDLDESETAQLALEIRVAAAALRAVLPFERVNVGALGNIVRQLHIHVIGRHEFDSAWPGPVWGQGLRVPRETAQNTVIIEQLRLALAHET